MRPARFVVPLMLALALAACAHALPEGDVTRGADLDSMMYTERAAPSETAGAPAVVTAVASTRPIAPASPAPAQAAPLYTLGPGDKLRVVVFGQEGLTNSYLVDAAGNITMPLVGAIAARSRTTQELARAVAERLRHGYVREPHVAIEVEAYRPFFILGEVTAPGQYPFVPNMTIETAVAIAGGFTPRAFRRNVRITRTTNGEPAGGTVPLSHPVNPGDTITVNERWF